MILQNKITLLTNLDSQVKRAKEIISIHAQTHNYKAEHIQMLHDNKVFYMAVKTDGNRKQREFIRDVIDNISFLNMRELPESVDNGLSVVHYEFGV